MKFVKTINWICRGMMVFGVIGTLQMIRNGIEVGPGWWGGPLLAVLLIGPGFAMYYLTRDGGRYGRK